MVVIRTGVLMAPEHDEGAAQAVRAVLRAACPGAVVIMESSAASQRNWVEAMLVRWCDEEELDLVLTVGGTLPAAGPSAREIVPEATMAVVERLLPGLGEAMRAYAQERSMLALLDRGVAGIRGRTLVINLPGGASAAALFLEAVAELIEPVVMHLQARADAPSLAEELDNVMVGASDDPGESGPVEGQIHTGGLSAEEFAAFLRRTSGGSSADQG